MHSIFKKEIIDAVRDRRLLLSSALVLALLAVALFSGYTRFATLKAERDDLNAANRKDWETQELKHVHGAAHYGTYIYVPQPFFSFFDFGVQNYTGSSIRVEAHLQQDATFSNAAESSGSIRFGSLNIALLLQVLFPLLFIFMCFNAVSGEKERSTLKLLWVQGAPSKKILWQKTWAYTTIASSLLLLVITASVAIATFNGLAITNETLLQAALLLLLYGAFYFILIAITMCVSAVGNSSRNALMVMLGFWLGFIILLPKYTANLGDDLYPLPSKKVFEKAIAHDVKNGINGHNPDDERGKQFTDSILKAYKVDTVSKLPINISGLLMQADEDYKAMVTKKYFGQLYQQIAKQNAVVEYSTFINPFIGLRDLSMAICRTDYANQVLFEQEVQRYRLYMMRYLNEYMSYHTKAGDWDAKAPRKVFTGMKKFNFQPASVMQSIGNFKLLVITILLWLVMAYLLLEWSAKKMEAV